MSYKGGRRFVELVFCDYCTHRRVPSASNNLMISPIVQFIAQEESPHHIEYRISSCSRIRRGC